MNGRQQIAEHKSRIDAVFIRAKALEHSAADNEIRADYARYLCVLVSGFLEKSVGESLLQHSRNCAAPSLQRFVENSTRNFTNVKCERLKSVLGSFDSAWRKRMDLILVDEVKDAVDSLVANRHLIAHGGSVGITYVRVSNYYKHVQTVIDEVQQLCDPV